jgi:hypothetical protein
MLREQAQFLNPQGQKIRHTQPCHPAQAVSIGFGKYEVLRVWLTRMAQFKAPRVYD